MEKPLIFGRTILFGNRGQGPVLPTLPVPPHSFSAKGEEKLNKKIADRKGTEGNLLNLFHLISLNHVKTKPQNVLHSGLCPTQCAN